MALKYQNPGCSYYMFINICGYELPDRSEAEQLNAISKPPAQTLTRQLFFFAVLASASNKHPWYKK